MKKKYNQVSDRITMVGYSRMRGPEEVIDYYLYHPKWGKEYAFTRKYSHKTYDLVKGGISIKRLLQVRSKDNQIAEDIINLWANALDVTIEPVDKISIATFNENDRHIEWSFDESEIYLKAAFGGDRKAIGDCQRFFIDELPWKKEDDWSDISLYDFMPSNFASSLGVVTLEQYRKLQINTLVDKAHENGLSFLRSVLLMIPALKLIRKFVMDYEPTSEESLYIAINVWNLESELAEKGYHKKNGDELEDLFFWLNGLYSDFNSGKIVIDDITEVEYKMGICYAFGIGVDKNITMCEELWRKAIVQPKACYNVNSIRICKFFFEGRIHINHCRT